MPFHIHAFLSFIVVLSIHFVTVEANDLVRQPNFNEHVKALFDSMKTKVKQDTCLTNLWCDTLLSPSIHICHRFPDAAIRHILDTKWDKTDVIEELVRILFKFDEEAYALNRWTEEKNFVNPSTIKEFISHKGQNFPQAHGIPFFTSITSDNIDPIHFLKEFKDLNTKLKEEAKTLCLVQREKQKCYSKLYSAPANLRLGFGPVNMIIGDNLDLMGKGDGSSTTDEKVIVVFFNIHYINSLRTEVGKARTEVTYTGTGELRELCPKDSNTYCMELNGINFFLSSTTAQNHGYVCHGLRGYGC